jgi:hypothetical protein
MRNFTHSATLLLCAVLVGCATIIHGGSQDVSVASSPSGAEVEINGQDIGETPVTRSLDRGDQHTITLDLDGYESESVVVEKDVSGWVWGNIVFGGLIGLVVDASTGGLYNLEPAQINQNLDEETAQQMKDSDVFISVVMEPDPDWKKIGQLKRSR